MKRILVDITAATEYAHKLIEEEKASVKTAE